MLTRRFNIKMLALAIVLVSTMCLSAFAALKSGGWTLNPADFRYDMSLYFALADRNLEDLDKFEIGAFINDECRGVAEKLTLTEDESCLYMRIRSNSAQGAQIEFRLREKGAENYVVLKPENGADFIFKSNERVGMPSSPFILARFYNAVFKVDGEEIAAYQLQYGAPLTAPTVPEKEGYTFNGWGDLPATMPAHDLEMHSTYTVNQYLLTFSIGDEILYSAEVPFGSSILSPEAPAKEGLTFSGWGDVPETMPAHNLSFEGSYEVNSYNLTYRIDGEVVHTEMVKYGETLPAFSAPEKEGFSFSGWSEIPALMPAHDVEINGSYTVNSYIISFLIGDLVVASDVLPYGAEIIAPDAPAKEGYAFNGWSEYPSTMPANDLEVTGDYKINVYTVTYNIDEEFFTSQEYEYDAPIVTPEVPEKEGKTFSGWGDVPATMPAFDLVLGGTFAENYYTVTFRIDGVVIFTDDIPYGTPISAPEAPEKEGYTFNGWGDVPATMPASNLDFFGSYSINHYNLTFRIDDLIVFEGQMPYGSEIVVPEAPAKEGYSFAGWGVVPAVMPASDLVINGTYEVNSYVLTFMLDGEVYFTTQVPFGAEIVAPDVPSKEGHSFTGWSELPSVMPVHDVVVAGSFSIESYSLTFRIGDEIIFSGQLPYGAEIVIPDAPAKEGHTFAGWGVVPATMPACDLEIGGNYDVNVYSLTFDIDGEVFFTTQLAYGTPIVVPAEVPEKDGQAFMGWGDVPATMPAYDLVISGTYSVNHYTLTFRIGDEIIFTGEQPYGSEIIVPIVPEKEGFTFSGWGEVPATMPSRNLEFLGSYEANFYRLTFKIDNDVIYSESIAYGSEIIIPEVAEKEGHTFSGWGVVPATMPASNLEFTGSYEVNVYSLFFKIDGEVVLSAQLPYGAEIEAPEAPGKEGHSFAGWAGLPKTMPATDLEISGSYEVNSYKVTFLIDGVVIHEISVSYGDEILLPEVPEKEGYSFAGWGVVPATMPAQDLEIRGSYFVNYYRLVVYLNEDIYMESSLAYGDEIVVPDPVLPDDKIFKGWKEEIPSVMPAYDIEIHGIVEDNISTSVGVIVHNKENYIYTLDGVLLHNGVITSEITDRLTPGIYIINGKKTVVK